MAQHPVHDYTQLGAFTVTLTVTDTATGEWDDLTRTGYVTVTPVAGFTAAPRQGPAPLTVHFTDTSSSGVDQWYWAFGDGGTSAAQHPVYTYTQAGLFSVTQRVTDTATGAWDVLSRTGYVTVTPVAGFTAAPRQGPAPLTVHFTDTSSSGVDGWHWTFGDGGTGTAQHPVYTYTQAGVFTVTLTVTDTATGAWDDLSRTGYVTVTPVAGFTAAPRQGLAPLTVHFTDTSSSGVDGWSWTFGDGGTSAAQHPVYTYTQLGAFTVTLTVTDTATGEWDGLSRTSYVTVTPVAGFTAAPRQGPVPLTVHFTDTSSSGVDEWSWTFGDGGTSAAQDPVYTYTQAGVFTVTLTVTDTATGEGDTAVEAEAIHAVGPTVITYTYDPLQRLTGAEYSTGERFEYAYDAVGNRTVMTDATGVTTYTYDAANRLTSVGGVSYTWDERGNLTSDGTFTYTYSAAGRMVRTEGVTLTLVYTYAADGLRVAQSVDGDVITFTWDWASGVPELLAAAESTNPDPTLYLVGHETLARWDGVAWAYHLPNALGSVRQAVDGAGAVLDAREWTPYGVEVGAAQVGLGYTGEWWDADVELLYLRARWYEPYLNQFISPDTIVPDFWNPQSINRYTYALGNPVNLVDPSGHCANDCECFIEEVERFIALAQSHTLVWVQLDDSWVVQMLGGYYAGFRMTQNVFGCSLAIPPGVIVRDPTPERWPVPGDLLWQVFDEPPVEGAEEQALSYGFKRIFYNNTHHYFANFYEAYFYGSTIARQHNNRREVSQYTDEGHPYYESAADILIAEVAIRHARQALDAGIETLPQLQREDACGNSLEEIYAEWVWPNPTVESWLGPPPQE